MILLVCLLFPVALLVLWPWVMLTSRCRERLTFQVPDSTDLTRSQPRVEGGQHEPSFRELELPRVRGYHQEIPLRVLTSHWSSTGHHRTQMGQDVKPMSDVVERREWRGTISTEYLYYFGACWEHHISFSGVTDPGLRSALAASRIHQDSPVTCIAGEVSCCCCLRFCPLVS